MDKSRDNRIVYEMIPNKVRSVNLFFCSPCITLRLGVSSGFTVVCLHEGLLGVLSRGIIDKQRVGCCVLISPRRRSFLRTFITHIALYIPSDRSAFSLLVSTVQDFVVAPS